jgi:hypothetical protein
VIRSGGRAAPPLVWTALAMAALLIWTERSPAQEGAPNEWEIPDTVFAAQPPRAPITYFTTYDLNVSRSVWSQMLSYGHTGRRVSFGVDANMNTLQPVRGLETEGRDGSITGRLQVRATQKWLWSVDGLFDMSSNEDPRSSTQRRQNKVQLRTQYSTPILPGLSGTALLFTELQQEQGLSRKTLPPDTLARDSTYTSGRRDGVSGTLKWSPAPWLDVTGLGSGNWNHLTTNTRQLKYLPVGPRSPHPPFVPPRYPDLGGGLALVGSTLDTTQAPTGDERFETSAFYRGIPRTTVGTVLKSRTGTQTMYVPRRRGQDTLSWYDRTASVRIEHTPVPGSQLLVEGSVAQAFREYKLQENFNSLGRTHAASVNFFSYQLAGRMAAGFQLTRVRNDRQSTQNGLVINRAMNASAARRITDRLWLEGAGTLSLYSRRYDNPLADKDDLRGYANVGGGYRVSSRCSTAVHFSVTRAHTVSIAAASAAENNVQTSYQMDAVLRLQFSPTLLLQQNYQINANYFIYDFDFQEGRNSLTRIRRIDTVVSDSLFDFAILRLTHNFFAQDRGSYARSEEDGPRKYAVSLDLYVQNVSVMLGIRPFPGVVLNATQSLGNTRTYTYGPPTTGNRNRWNLNLGAQVDRTLPGELTLQGSIQHIGEYTEAEEDLPRRDEVDYWLAGASLTKNF